MTGRQQIVVCTKFDRNCFCLFGASRSQRHLTAEIVLGDHCYLPWQRASNQICTSQEQQVPQNAASTFAYSILWQLIHCQPSERLWAPCDPTTSRKTFILQRINWFQRDDKSRYSFIRSDRVINLWFFFSLDLKSNFFNSSPCWSRSRHIEICYNSIFIDGRILMGFKCSRNIFQKYFIFFSLAWIHLGFSMPQIRPMLQCSVPLKLYSWRQLWTHTQTLRVW